jgi:hypothetical protein
MNEENKTEVSHDITEQAKTDTKADLFSVYEKELSSSSPKAKENMQLVQKLLNEYGGQFQKDTLQHIVSPDFKTWIISVWEGFEKNIASMVTFIDEKLDTQSQFDIADMKTYIESQNVVSYPINKQTTTIKNNVFDISSDNIDEYERQILQRKATTQEKEITTQEKEITTQEKEITTQDIKTITQKEDSEEKWGRIDVKARQDKILSSISDKLSTQTSQITSNPAYQAEKTTFEQQLWKKVDDNYFVSRFALGHVWESNGYLTQEDLWGQKQEDLIARLNEKYQVNEVISLQDKTFQNSQFDGRMSGETRQDIATKWWSLETVFTAAELEFFKKDSTLRTNLHGLVQWWLFPDVATATKDTPYWNGEQNGENWIPQPALQNTNSFSQWMEQSAIPNTIKTSWLKYYTDVYKLHSDTPWKPLTDAEKNTQDRFLQNLALVESTRYRNTVQDVSTKVVAENLFADIASMTWKDIAWSSDWKLVKQSWKSDYFTMDAVWNTTMQYELHGVKWDITIDKDGVVTLGPVLWQDTWYADLIAKKRVVWKILWVTHYIKSIADITHDSWNVLRNLPPEKIATEIRKNIVRDQVASDVTKATMQTNIARQSMFDAMLSTTNSPRATSIKWSLNTTNFSDKSLVQGTATDDYSLCLKKLHAYSLVSSKSEIEKVTSSYNTLQQYLTTNPTFSENTAIKKNPEHLATMLNKFPIEKWWDIKMVWEKQFTEEKNKALIDNELSVLEKKIDNDYA